MAKLTAADGLSEDEFGSSASVSGDTALIGAVGDNFGGGWAQGSAYIFHKDQGGPNAWGQVAKIAAADGAADDSFAYTVSVSDDTAVVGAVRADVGGNTDQGAAYVFYRDQGGPDAWGQVAKLTAADGAANDLFGDCVSVSGDTAVVGARYGSGGLGAAYVFYRDQGGPDAWGQVAKLTAADGAEDDTFGHAVSVSGDTAFIGADGAVGDGGSDQGAAYVFYRDQGGPDTWGQVAKLTAADGATEDHFGYSVWVSSDTAVIGAVGDDFGGGWAQGSAYIFYRDQGGPNAWGQVAKLAAADGAAGDEFGLSVSVSGDTAVAGALLADVSGNSDQGAAYVFYRDQGGPDAWGQAAKLTADDGAAEDRFGRSVWVGGDTALIGAYLAWVGGNWRQGAAYVFALPVAVDDGYCTPEDTPLEVPAALGVLANDMNRGGDPLTAVLDSGPSYGTLDLHADGSFTYTSTTGLGGVDTLTYHANDGALDSNIATVQITVPCYYICLPVVMRSY